MAFRDLASEARNRAIADLANPALAKHPSRTGVTLTYSVHAAEAVVLSVVALESGINEIADWVRLGLSPLKPAHGLPPGFSDLSLADKWEAIPKAFVGRSFDKSAEPWQSFLTLGKLRDALVHFKWQRRSVPRFMRALQTKGVLIPEDNAVYWVDAALTDRVAVWAVETSDAMFAGVAALLGFAEHRFWPWR